MRSQTRRILEGFFNLHKQQMKRDSMIFYRSFYESVNGLSPVIKAELYDAIFEYGLNFQEIEFTNEISKALFTLIKPQLDANIKRFENGKKPKTKQIESKTEAKDKQKESKVEANNNVNVNVNENKNIEERKLKFADALKPFLDEYGRELLNDFYFYWTEHGENDKKLRFEKEKTFGISQRLRTWYNRNPKQYKKEETDHLVEYVNKQLGL
jgi:hypothetical protein